MFHSLFSVCLLDLESEVSGSYNRGKKLAPWVAISGRMDEDLVNQFSKFKLKPQEVNGIDIVVKDIAHRQDECERSLLGKIWGNKTANFTGLRNTLTPLWCHKGELRVVELSSNFFQFIFSNKEEKERVLMKRPWIFDNQFGLCINGPPS